MNKEKDFFKTCFNTVAGLEVKNESQAIAKEVVLSEVENLQQENRKQKEIIDKAIDFIKNGDLLYLANKNSIVYRNNIEIRAVADRLNDLLQILEDKEVSE